MIVKKSCRYESEIKYNDCFTFKMVLDNDRHMPPRMDSNSSPYFSPYGEHVTIRGFGTASFANTDQIKWLIASLSDFLKEVEEEQE